MFTLISHQTIARMAVLTIFTKIVPHPHAKHAFTNAFHAPNPTIKPLARLVSLDLTGPLPTEAVSATPDTLTIGTLSLAGRAPLLMQTVSLASILSIPPNLLQTIKPYSPQPPGQPPSNLITNAPSANLLTYLIPQIYANPVL
jgi:hypothetical protein